MVSDNSSFRDDECGLTTRRAVDLSSSTRFDRPDFRVSTKTFLKIPEAEVVMHFVSIGTVEVRFAAAGFGQLLA